MSAECPGVNEQLKRPGLSKRSTTPALGGITTLWAKQCQDSGSSYREEAKSSGPSPLGILSPVRGGGGVDPPAAAAQPSVDAADADTDALIDALLAVRAKLEDADTAVENALVMLGVEEASDEEEDADSDAEGPTADAKASRRA